jgi:diguanylate cyclase (GGDEF)-like protein
MVGAMTGGSVQEQTAHRPELAGHRRSPPQLRGPRLIRLVETGAVLLLLAGCVVVALLASAHVTTASLQAAAAADRAMVEHLLTDLGPAAAIRDDPVSRERAMDVVGAGGALGVVVLAPSGDELLAAGVAPPPGPPSDLGAATLVRTDAGWRLVATFPAFEGREAAARVIVVRDGTQVREAIEAAQREIGIAAGAAALVLVVVLFVVFRGAQSRIDRQTAILVEASHRDPLTGLLTYGASIGELAAALAALEERPIAIALIDVDNFRRLNEVHGSAAGDAVLTTVAGALTASPASAESSVGRSGPDEFIVVAPGLESHALADWLGGVQERLARTPLAVADADDPLPIAFAAGVAVAPLEGRTAVELFSVASAALDEARSGGGAQILIGSLTYLAAAQPGALSMLEGLIEAIDHRDRYTRRHCEDVARYAVYLAARDGADPELCAAVQAAAMVHDVGKIAVPDDILRKPAPLAAAEAEAMQQHVVLGGILVRDVANETLIAEGVEYHHERWDGTGYAIGLAGEAIPLIARIVAVADAYSAMTTSRPYRAAINEPEALRRLAEAAGTQLDPRLTAVFVSAMLDDAEAPRPSDPRKPSFWLPTSEAA